VTRDSTDNDIQPIVHAVTLVAAMAVGVLIGRTACEPEPETVVEKKTVQRTPDCPPCQPDTGTPDVSPDGVVAASPDPPEDKGNRPMPEDPGPPDPTIRRRMLSWVRDQAPGLRECRPGGGSSVRLAVTLTLTETGEVERAEINAPEKDLSRKTLRCLRDKMQQWSLPENLLGDRRRVVFGLDV